MALARVAASAKATATSINTIVVSVATRPTVGNALIILANTFGSASLNLPTDNNGNTYSLGKDQLSVNSRATIFYCPILTSTATGGTFQVTMTATGSKWWVVMTVEVSGVGTGLAIDQSISATGSSTTPSTGSTAALTAAETFQAATHAINATETTITVGVVSPAWTQEFEELPSTLIAGEADTRIVTGGAGTTPSASWTDSTTGVWSAVLVAFKAVGVAAVERTQSFVVLPL